MSYQCYGCSSRNKRVSHEGDPAARLRWRGNKKKKLFCEDSAARLLSHVNSIRSGDGLPASNYGERRTQDHVGEYGG